MTGKAHDVRHDKKCYACGRKFRVNGHGFVVFHHEALTIDGQRQFVGFDCMKHIVKAGSAGYQPPRGGPRLYAEQVAPPDVLAAAGITRVSTSDEVQP